MAERGGETNTVFRGEGGAVKSCDHVETRGRTRSFSRPDVNNSAATAADPRHPIIRTTATRVCRKWIPRRAFRGRIQSIRRVMVMARVYKREFPLTVTDGKGRPSGSDIQFGQNTRIPTV